MRVGLVAKGLLLKGDKDLELVLLCSKKPTVSLLKQVAEKLTAQLEVGMSVHSCFKALLSKNMLHRFGVRLVLPPFLSFCSYLI